MDSVLKSYEDDDGQSMLVKCYNGLNLPYLIPGNVADHFADLKKLEYRPDDVLLMTYPRCGTHWAREMINMLMKGRTEYIDKSEVDSPIEVTPIDAINGMKSPRPLYTHLYFEYIPTKFVENKGKIVNIIRNPKDCAVSFYNFGKSFADAVMYGQPGYNGTWEQWFKLYIKGQVPYDSYFRYQKAMDKLLEENPDYPVLHLLFEDIKNNPLVEVTKLAKFLEVPFTEELLSDIVDKCSFSKMKRQKSESLTKFAEDCSKDGTDIFYRKGEVGDWKNYFTVAQNEQFDVMYLEEMRNCKHIPRYM